MALRHASRTFEGDNATVALRNVTLDISAGEFVAITGPSGSGKSTLLNLIGLLDHPSTGTVTVDGIDAFAASDGELTRLRSETFAFIFQSFHLLERRPVIDSVELALQYQSVPGPIRRAAAARALRQVGLLGKAWQDVNTLSGGERQRVAIARAVASGARVIIADEPTGNLDSDNAKGITELLLDLHASGVTIVLVTHSPELAAIGSRKIIIRDGRVVSDEQLRRVGAVGTARLPQARHPRRHQLGQALRDLLRDAFNSVRARGTRTLGLVAAVAVAVALAIATFGITDSASAQVSDTFNAHTSRDVMAQWSPDALAAVPASERKNLPKRISALSGISDAALLSDLGGHVVQVTPAREALQIDIFEASDDIVAAARMRVRYAPDAGTSGADISGARATGGAGALGDTARTSADTAHTSGATSKRLRTDEVYIGATLAKRLDLAPVELRPAILIDGTPQTVVGLITYSPREPRLLGSVLSAEKPTWSSSQDYAVVLTQAGAAAQIAKQLPLVINPYAPKKIRVDYPKDPTTLRAELQSDVRNTLIAFTGVALLAAIAGLANAMMLSVVERRQELGLRRAIGARKTQVTGLIIVESSILGAIGGVVGFAIGILATLAMTVVRHWIPTLDLRLAPAAILGGILVGILGGLLASVRASSINPSQALRL